MNFKGISVPTELMTLGDGNSCGIQSLWQDALLSNLQAQCLQRSYIVFCFFAGSYFLMIYQITDDHKSSTCK